MFNKILVLSVTVAIASCSDRHYLKHAQHKSHKEHRPYEHRIQVHEPSSEEYKPDYRNAYSSHRIVQQGQTYESHESTDHAAPVYEYKVNEQDEDEVHDQHKYRPIYQHENQAVNVPAHYKIAYPESPEAQGESVYHRTQSHEPLEAYYHPEVYEAYKKVAHGESDSPRTQFHEAHKVYYQPEIESHQKVQPRPTYHAVSEHHAVGADSHESHDEPIDYYAYPKYQYEYKVEDPHTGDNKYQHEIRDGDVVKGVYGLHEADGSFRTVEYSSDKHQGFVAIVKHSAPGQHVHIETHHENEHQNDHQN